MKNIKYFDGNAFEFHKEVVNSKNKTSKDPLFKERITNMNEIIEEQFFEYDTNFETNTLENISSIEFSSIEKEDLGKLYSYKSSVIKKMKNIITTTDTNRIINTCPNCTISKINSFDHYLPQSKFPEFIVNPKNLFPSCTICNGIKNAEWIKDGERLFLNLYLDKLPIEQYLFVDLTIENDLVTTKFYLKNNGNISCDIFKIILSHYSKLNLLKRFSEDVCDVIVTLENTIKSFIGKLSLNGIKESIIEKSNRDREVFGYNYWKSILEIKLVNCDEYMNRFIQ